MKVAVMGGTGKMGGAIARALSKKHQVIIGSRERARAQEAAKRIPGVTGADYLSAAVECDIAVFAIPFSAMGEASWLAVALSGKLVVSTMNPLKREGDVMVYPLEKGSAAETLAGLLPRSRVATAFNNIPETLLDAGEHSTVDILVAASSKSAYEETAGLVSSIPGLRPLYAGPLSNARLVELLTLLELNVVRLNGTGRLSPRFVVEGE